MCVAQCVLSVPGRQINISSEGDMSIDAGNTVMSALVVAQGKLRISDILSVPHPLNYFLLEYLGAHGFATTGSRPALAMGLLIGGLYAASGYFVSAKTTKCRGYALAAITSIALCGRMGHYYFKYVQAAAKFHFKIIHFST